MRRIGNLNRELDRVFTDSVVDRLLRCSVCGYEREALASYWRTGWPKHHGYTMTLVGGV